MNCVEFQNSNSIWEEIWGFGGFDIKPGEFIFNLSNLIGPTGATLQTQERFKHGFILIDLLEHAEIPNTLG